jgi:hypothetical protein
MALEKFVDQGLTGPGPLGGEAAGLERRAGREKRRGRRPALNPDPGDKPEQITRILKLSSQTIIESREFIGLHGSDEGITVLRLGI